MLHGAGIFSYIETPIQSPSHVGKYSSTMVRIWDTKSIISISTRWCFPQLCLLVNKNLMNTIVISMINPSYCSYVHQLNAIKLGLHLVDICEFSGLLQAIVGESWPQKRERRNVNFPCFATRFWCPSLYPGS